MKQRVLVAGLSWSGADAVSADVTDAAVMLTVRGPVILGHGLGAGAWRDVHGRARPAAQVPHRHAEAPRFAHDDAVFAAAQRARHGFGRFRNFESHVRAA